jgi:threonine aldolase
MKAINRNFTSDNVTPVCPPIMAAINAANTGVMGSYGADVLTDELTKVACAVFETEVAIYPVASGTAANSLALAQIAPPFGGVYCYEAAHIVTDECGAPEFFTGGAKLLGLPAADGKILPESVRSAIALANEMGVHHVQPAALSVTQATEWGTVYDPAELAALGAVAKQQGLLVHMDGARFANAAAHLNCSAAELTWKCGVDVLTLGATKNGALCAEAVVFFDAAVARNFERRRKRAGHLWSKQRYLSAQLLAYLSEDLWLHNARQANAMAGVLAQGLREIPGARVLQAVQANEVFAALPEGRVAALEQAGFRFYRWPQHPLTDAIAFRMVTSYATERADVDAFIRAAAAG